LEEPVLDRGQRHRTGDRFGMLPRRLCAGDLWGEFVDGLVQEQVLRGDPQSRLPGPGHDLHAEDRVAAEIEEVVPYADPVHPEDGRPDLGERVFGRRAWLSG